MAYNYNDATRAFLEFDFPFVVENLKKILLSDEEIIVNSINISCLGENINVVVSFSEGMNKAIEILGWDFGKREPIVYREYPYGWIETKESVYFFGFLNFVETKAHIMGEEK